jgi:hypothetical protein
MLRKMLASTSSYQSYSASHDLKVTVLDRK